MLSSVLVLLLFSVVVIGGADAHAHPSSTIRQRTLQDTVPACDSSLQPNDECDVATQDGNQCGFGGYVYVGDCGGTAEELECLPEMTCTCNGIRDGKWACPLFRRRDAMTEEMMPDCPDNLDSNDSSDVSGATCTPPSPTSAASSSVTANDDNNDMNDGIDRLDTMNGADNSATAIDETLSASKNTMDNDNGIDSVEVTTPAVADDNESSTTITVKEGESDAAMSSLSSSSSQHQGLGVGKVTMVAVATTTATGIALFL